MSIIEQEYENITKVFNMEKNSFKKREDETKNILFSSINWSNTFLDFFPYESMIKQLKPPIIYKEEKLASVKNHFLNDKLIFAFKNENQKWGTTFVDYEDTSKRWVQFLESYENEIMFLQQLQIAYFQNNRYEKVVWYMNDQNDGEESMCVYLFEYDLENNLKKIIRHAFLKEKFNTMPDIEYNFSYNKNKVEIYADHALVKDLFIYKGKKIY